MARCTINCGNNLVEVYALLCLFYKIPLNNPMTIIVGVWVINHHLRVYLVSVMVGWDCHCETWASL